MTTGQKIYECRKKSDMTQEELADKLNVSRQSVSKWESDGAFPETDKILELCKLFHLSADELLFGETEQIGRTETEEENPMREKTESAKEESTKEERKDVFNFTPSGALHYEYVSKARLWGIPVVHINIGLGVYRAKGIIAIGTIATGLLSLGILSLGLLAFGTLSLGLFAFGALAFGGISFGGVAIGILVFGGVAVGVFAIGGLSVGYFAFGGIARGYYAFGDWANGWFAAGKTRAEGLHAFYVKEQYDALCAWVDGRGTGGWGGFLKRLAGLLLPS